MISLLKFALIKTIVQQDLLVEKHKKNLVNSNVVKIEKVDRNSPEDLLANLDSISNQDVDDLLSQMLEE